MLSNVPSSLLNSLLQHPIPLISLAITGLEGVDAFEKLKAEAAKATISHPPKALQLPQPAIPDPAVAKAALEVTAREGLPVTGVNAAAWEALRPKIVPETKANKVRSKQTAAGQTWSNLEAARLNDSQDSTLI